MYIGKTITTIIFVGATSISTILLASSVISSDLKAADDELNRVYKQLRDILAPNAQEKLLSSQKEWLNTRDRMCELSELPTNRDAWFAAISTYRGKVNCVTKVTNERITFLKHMPFALSNNFRSQDIEKRYPPYPQVWGYEIPASVVTIWKADNGDYLIKYATKIKQMSKADGACCRQEKYHVIQEYFSGKQMVLNVQDYNAFGAKYRDQIIWSKPWKPIKFQDGTTIRQKGTGGGNCYSPYNYWLEKKAKNSSVILRKSLFHVLDKPRVFGLRESCGDGVADISERAVSLHLGAIDLEDETFLAYQAYGKFIVRLDKNMNSNFSLLNKRMFLINTEVIDQIKIEAKKQAGTDIPLYYQKVNDMVYRHLQKIKERR